MLTEMFQKKKKKTVVEELKFWKKKLNGEDTWIGSFP